MRIRRRATRDPLRMRRRVQLGAHLRTPFGERMNGERVAVHSAVDVATIGRTQCVCGNSGENAFAFGSINMYERNVLVLIVAVRGLVVDVRLCV